MKTKKLSVVLPVYLCADCITEIHKQLSDTYNFLGDQLEIIFVNDGSPDHSWSLITDLVQRDSNVVGINLSRNFGQHFAIMAGIDQANGERVMTMDCDLEDSPAESLKLYKKLDADFDIAWGRRNARTHGLIKKLGSQIFYWVFNSLSDFKRDPRIGSFVCFKHNVKEALKALREQSRFIPSLLDWLGFSVIVVDVEHQERFAGTSAYNFRRLFQLAVEAIVSHSTKPLFFILKLGMFISSLVCLYVCWTVFQYFTSGIAVSGWTSLMVMVGISTSLLTLLLGVVGFYVGRIYVEVKNRPLYLIKETRQKHKQENHLAA